MYYDARTLPIPTFIPRFFLSWQPAEIMSFFLLFYSGWETGNFCKMVSRVERFLMRKLKVTNGWGWNGVWADSQGLREVEFVQWNFLLNTFLSNFASGSFHLKVTECIQFELDHCFWSNFRQNYPHLIQTG
jgi:hypothetical protein